MALYDSSCALMHFIGLRHVTPLTQPFKLYLTVTDTSADDACTLLQTAQLLYEKGWLPEVVMSSNSQRTRQTLEAMKEAVGAFR